MAKDYADAEFLEYVVKALVDEPDKVEVERKVDEMGVLLTLKVSAPDMGKIIGRNGNTAKAIRSLLRVVGMKNNARVNLKIEEPEGGRGPTRERAAYVGQAGEPEGGQSPRMERATDVDQALEDLKL